MMLEGEVCRDGDESVLFTVPLAVDVHAFEGDLLENLRRAHLRRSGICCLPTFDEWDIEILSADEYNSRWPSEYPLPSSQFAVRCVGPEHGPLFV